MGNQQNKLERQFNSPSAQNFPGNGNGSPNNNSNGAGGVQNPNFVRKSVRGSRASKRKLKQTMAALRHQTMEVDGLILPVIDAIFIRNYPLRTFINLQEFEVEGVISKGAFGNVLKVKGREDGNGYALKVMKKSKIVLDQAVQQCNDEAAIHHSVGRHPFIVQALWYYQNKDNIYIVLEYIPRGELFSAWKHYGHFSEALVQIYIAELAMVIDYLHHNHVIYRDLKMENVLIDAQGHIQLIDFGLAKWLQFGQRTRTVCGTLQYIAPEVLTMEEYGHSVDWWSLGIMMFALLTGQYPVRGAKDHFEMAEKVMGHEYELPGTHSFSREARGCIRRLLKQNPSDRLCDLYELENDPFFTSLNFSSLLEKQISPKAHLQLQHSDEKYGFIHSRDQSFDGYLATNLMDAAGGSMDSLDSIDDFAGFDMTRSQSVDGLFTDSRQLNSATAPQSSSNINAKNNNNTIAQRPSQPPQPPTVPTRDPLPPPPNTQQQHQQQPSLARSNSHDQLLSTNNPSTGATGNSYPQPHPQPAPRKVTDFYLPPPPSTPPSSLATPGSRTSFDRERLGRMGAKQHVPMIAALLNDANRSSNTSTEIADDMGRSAQSKRVREPPRERIEFDPVPQKSRAIETSGGERRSRGMIEAAGGRRGTEDDGEEDYRQAMRNTAMKIVKKRSKSVDLLGGGATAGGGGPGSVSSKRLSTSDAPPPPPRLYNQKSYLNKSVDGVSNAPSVRVRPERAGRSIIQHRKTASKDSSKAQKGSLEHLSQMTNQGSLEDLNPPTLPPRPTKAIALADLQHHQLEEFLEKGHRHSYHPSAAVVNNSQSDALKRRSNPDFNFAAMHKKALSPSPAGAVEIDPAHRRMESLTGETTHHVDKVREWLCSTPDVETMERYEFEHDIEVTDNAKDTTNTVDNNDDVRYKDSSSDVNQNRRKTSSATEPSPPKMPGSVDNRMQFIDQQQAKTIATDQHQIHQSASGLELPSDSKVARPSPQKASKDLFHRQHSQPQLPPRKEREEKENLPPSQPSLLRPKAQLSPQEDYPPYLSSQLSQSTQALFERMSRSSGKPLPGANANANANANTAQAQQQMYLYRYSDSTNLTPAANAQRASQVSSSGLSGVGATPKDVQKPLEIVTTDVNNLVSGVDTVNNSSMALRDHQTNGVNVTYGPGASQSQQTLSSPVSSYATVIEHSIASETNTTSNNRNSYVNEKDWAKALENLGLASFRKDSSSVKPKQHGNNTSRSEDSSRHNTPSPAKFHSRPPAPPILETDFPANEPSVGNVKGGGGGAEWSQPKLRSLRSTASVNNIEQQQQYYNQQQRNHHSQPQQQQNSSSNRSTPSSAQSAPVHMSAHQHQQRQHSYINHQQLKQPDVSSKPVENIATDDLGYVNALSKPSHSYSVTPQPITTRDFVKTPAKPPRKSPPGDNKDKGVIRDKVGAKDGLFMELNDARRLLYEGHPPDAAVALSCSSMQSFVTATENERSLQPHPRSKSTNNMAEEDPIKSGRQQGQDTSSPAVFRSHSVEDNLSERHRFPQNQHQESRSRPLPKNVAMSSPYVPRKEFCSPGISNASSQVSISQATGKSSSSETRTSSPGKVRSSTQSPIDNLWQQVHRRPGGNVNEGSNPSASVQKPQGDGRPNSTTQNGQNVDANTRTRTIPISASPRISQGEPKLSRKQQRLADVQSEESGYTSMGNSLGSKEGLGSPRFESKPRATTGNATKTAPPPVKPKPKIGATKQDVSKSQSSESTLIASQSSDRFLNQRSDRYNRSSPMDSSNMTRSSDQFVSSAGMDNSNMTQSTDRFRLSSAPDSSLKTTASSDRFGSSPILDQSSKSSDHVQIARHYPHGKADLGLGVVEKTPAALSPKFPVPKPRVSIEQRMPSPGQDKFGHANNQTSGIMHRSIDSMPSKVQPYQETAPNVVQERFVTVSSNQHQPQSVSEPVNVSSSTSSLQHNNTHSTLSINGLLQTDFPDVDLPPPPPPPPLTSAEIAETVRSTPTDGNGKQFTTSVSSSLSLMSPSTSTTAEAGGVFRRGMSQDRNTTKNSSSTDFKGLVSSSGGADTRGTQQACLPQSQSPAQFRATSNVVFGGGSQNPAGGGQGPTTNRSGLTPSSPSQRHTGGQDYPTSRSSLTPSPAASRHMQTMDMSLAPQSPANNQHRTPLTLSMDYSVNSAAPKHNRNVPTQLNLASPEPHISPELLSPGARKPAIAKKPLVLSPQHHGPKPIARTRSPNKGNFTPDWNSSNKGSQNYPNQKDDGGKSGTNHEYSLNNLTSPTIESKIAHQQSYSSAPKQQQQQQPQYQSQQQQQQQQPQYQSQQQQQPPQYQSQHQQQQQQHRRQNTPPTPTTVQQTPTTTTTTTSTIVETITTSGLPKNTYVNLDYTHARLKASELVERQTSLDVEDESKNPRYVNLTFEEIPPCLPPKSQQQQQPPASESLAPLAPPPLPSKSRSASESMFSPRPHTAMDASSGNASRMVNNPVGHQLPGLRSQSVGDGAVTSVPAQLQTSNESIESFAWSNMVADQSASFV